MIVIVKATLEDLPLIQALNQTLFNHDFPYDNFLKKDWPYTVDGVEYFKKSLTNERYVTFLASDNGQAIGYLIGYVWNPWSSRPVKTAEIDNMLIDGKYQHQGIGSKLISEFEAWCRLQDVKSLLVMTYSENLQAQSFYRKNNFKDLSLRLEKKLL